MRFMLALGLFSVLYVSPTLAQTWGDVLGLVRDARSGQGIPGATLLVEGTNYGTATDLNGQFVLRLPAGRYQIRISAVGYTSLQDSVTVRRDAVGRLDVRLEPSVLEMDGVEVTAQSEREAGVFEMTPRDILNLPGPFRSAFQAVRVLPGVSANNELSNQFSVRGGGLNENLIFLNGYEVYLPFRPRQGEQEGLGILNPDLTRSLTLYAGGFPARYGGKLASALDVTYEQPEDQAPKFSVASSLFDASATVTGGTSSFSYALGVRRAQARRLFGTQELKGRYDPDFRDVQAMATWRISPALTAEATGLFVRHRFNLEPTTQRTFYGVVSLDPERPSDFYGLFTSFSPGSFQQDGYDTGFGGLRLRAVLSPRFVALHDVSYFTTDEREERSVDGTSRLSQVDPGSGAEVPLADARQIDRTDNRVQVHSVTAQGQYVGNVGPGEMEVGWMARSLTFIDEIAESSIRLERSTRLVLDSLTDAARVQSFQGALYGQYQWRVIPQQPDRLVVTFGVRADRFSFNNETTVSPRINARFRWRPVTTLTAAAGVYHQTPSYLELRGRPAPGETILSALNDSVRSQRSVQGVIGVEHFLTRRRLFLRAEAYYKHLSDLITYDIENVRVRYSSNNDARGYIYGVDLQVRGEFVPGLESWANYSYLVARERFLPEFSAPIRAGLLARPTDQRHTFSLFVQDYIPGDLSWRLHLRALFGSGYPYTSINPGLDVNGVSFPQPGRRNANRFTEYRRLDLGTTKSIEFNKATLYLTGEILNIFDMTNEVAFQWVPAAGTWRRIPTRLTPRTLNVRFRLEF